MLRTSQGGTLLELLISIAVIGILAAIATPAYLQQRQKAQVAKVLVELEPAANAIAEYGVGNGKYPPDQNQGVRPPEVPPEKWPTDIGRIDYDHWRLGDGRCLVQITWFGFNGVRDSEVYTDEVGGDDAVVAIALYSCDRARGAIR